MQNDSKEQHIGLFRREPPSDYDQWTPNMQAFRVTIKFPIATGPSTATTERWCLGCKLMALQKVRLPVVQ